MSIAIRIILFILGILGVSDTLVLSGRSHLNFGIVMPFILALPLLFMAFFFKPVCSFFQASQFGHIVKWVICGGYALLILFVGTMSIIIYSAGSDAPKSGCDAVIVLGAGIRGERVSLTLARRLDAAKEYADSNPDSYIVVSGGKSDNEPISEAEAMRQYLVNAGFDESRIIIEAKAKSTYENFKFSLPLIHDKIGADAKIAFVTTRFHVFRAERVAKSLGIDAKGIGADGVSYITPNDYLRESFVVVYYLLTGKI